GRQSGRQRWAGGGAGEARSITPVAAKRPAGWVEMPPPQHVAEWLGLDPSAKRLVAWDVFDAVLMPGDVILLVSWRDQAAAEVFESTVALQNGARLRRVRVVRDYGMFDRREAPQYYPDVNRAGV